jgi:lipopolysaccharide export LptBFGC system permease protein LptF
MKTLHWYLTRQVLASLGLTVAVFTFVLLLGNLLREILDLIINRSLPLSAALQALGYLVPFVLVFSLPMGLLTATLLVFGRFSADQELTAVRAGGISLVALITPILLLSVVLCGVSAWFNLQLGPQCRMAYKELLFRLGVQRPTALLAENQFIRSFPGYILYVGKADGPRLKNLVVYQMDTNTPASDTDADAPALPASPALAQIPRVATILKADTATLVVDTNAQEIRLEMPEVEAVNVTSWQPAYLGATVLPLPFKLTQPRLGPPPLSDMTLAQLMNALYEYRRLGLDVTPDKVQMHRQAAFSFACLGYTLIGIPLAVRAHRRETSVGFGLALVLVTLYFSFPVLAQAWETRPERHPEWLLWVPNFLFLGVGAVLLWRVNRRG